MKIILAGGGTGGPVIPLMAVAAQIKKMDPNAEFLFVGTKSGPERTLVENAGFKFVSIPVAKFRRYFSLRNFTDLFVFIMSYFKARSIVRAFKPDAVFSVGGFVAVPVIWAARSASVKVVIHQQDAQIGLANKLSAPMAHVITTAFESTAKDFFSGAQPHHESARKIEWVGNPVREEFFDKSVEMPAILNLHKELPVLLVFGGATGAQHINDIVGQALPELVKSHQVIHVTGTGKSVDFRHENYHPFEFLGKEFPSALKLSDLVICRAGLSTIAELSVLGKIAVVVPMPKSHQEANAAILKDNSAAVVLNEEEFNPENLVRVVNSLKFNPKRRELLSANMSGIMPHDAAQRIAKLILENDARQA